MLNLNITHKNTINDKTNVSRSRINPRFKLVDHIEDNDIDDITEVVEVHVDWDSPSRTHY